MKDLLVLCSDATNFHLFRADGRVSVHEAMGPACEQSAAHVGGASVMVWGLCSIGDQENSALTEVP